MGLRCDSKGEIRIHLKQMRDQKTLKTLYYFVIILFLISTTGCKQVFDTIYDSGIKEVGHSIDSFFKSKGVVLNLLDCKSVKTSRLNSCAFKNKSEQMLTAIEVLHLEDADFKAYKGYHDILTNDEVLVNYVDDPGFAQSGEKYGELFYRVKSDCWEELVKTSSDHLELYSLFSLNSDNAKSREDFQYIDGKQIEDFFVLYDAKTSSGCVDFNFVSN